MESTPSRWTMRRQVTLASAAALVLVAAGDVTAASHDPDYVPYTPTERVYFHCVGDHQVQNVAGEIPGWDTTEPPGLLLRGEGCGTYDNAPMAGNAAGVEFDAQWAGTYTGNLRDMTFHLDTILVGGRLSEGGALLQFESSMVVSIKLFVDGELVPLADPDVPDDFFEVPVNRGVLAPSRVEVSITGIDLLEEEDNHTHDVRLVLHNNAESQNFWVFDAVEADAGITFNPGELAETQLRRAGS